MAMIIGATATEEMIKPASLIGFFLDSSWMMIAAPMIRMPHNNCKFEVSDERKKGPKREFLISVK
jgi:hypothetical protein